MYLKNIQGFFEAGTRRPGTTPASPKAPRPTPRIPSAHHRNLRRNPSRPNNPSVASLDDVRRDGGRSRPPLHPPTRRNGCRNVLEVDTSEN